MDIIRRDRILQQIVSQLNCDMMLVLVGQRRVGKTFMLLQLKEWIAANRPNANILFIDKESLEFADIADAMSLYKAAKAKLPDGEENYLLIDEVQDIAEYEQALRSLYAERRCQIVATGSNAYVFSSELSTKLSGRLIEVPVYGLTYPEFLIFHGLEDSDDSLMKFLRLGGLPGLRNVDISSEIAVRHFMEGVYNTVMVKDVMLRERLRNNMLITNLAKFTADCVGKPVSPNSIANALSSKGEKTSSNVISGYLNILCSALLITQVPRYDIHGKKLLEQLAKYYFTDHGIRNYLCQWNLLGSIEKVIENVVWHHLTCQDFKVAVGTLYRAEIDFVATKGERRIYVQAAYRLDSEETVKREFGNLMAIKDAAPKYVVSMDGISGELDAYPGIRHLSLREFLKMEF